MYVYRILFRTQDLSKVKQYCFDSWTRILENKASLQDFIFSKEVKMGTYRCVRQMSGSTSETVLILEAATKAHLLLV